MNESDALWRKKAVSVISRSRYLRFPETAIRHGVRNLYDTNENVTGGAKHLRYLLNRFHGNIRLALAAYNAGERKVDRYGQIPPYKETQDYVKKVLVYYRSYKKDGWIMPVAIAAPSMRAGESRNGGVSGMPEVPAWFAAGRR